MCDCKTHFVCCAMMLIKSTYRWERLEARGLRPTFTEANLLAVTTGQGPIMAEYTMLNVEDKRSVVFDGA